jgi:predicted O-methyltransferase YrrM
LFHIRDFRTGKENFMKWMVAVGVLAGVFAGAAGMRAWSGQDEVKRTRAERLEMLKNWKHHGLDTAADDAGLLRVLVTAVKAKRGVEVGSFKGFGAINMGMAFEQNKGRLFTHEIDAAIADECRANLKKAGLEETVTVVTGDALKTMPELEGEIDFVFIDAKKDDYLKYLKVLEPKLKAGALIVADNTIRSAKAMKDFLDYVQQSPDYDSVTIRASMEKNDGMTVICKLK